MGNYITAEILKERMGADIIKDLTSDATDAEAFIESAIERAEGIIDAYASRLYSIPLTPSGIIEEWACVLAEYEMYKRGQGNDVPVKYKDSRSDVLKQLGDMSNGLLLLTTSARRSASGNSIDVISDTPLFTEKALSGY